MAEKRQKLRGTTLELDQYLGAEGQLLMNLDNYELRSYDGVTLGGHRIPTLATAQAAFQLPDRLGVSGELLTNANDAIEAGFYSTDDLTTNVPAAGIPGSIITTPSADGNVVSLFMTHNGNGVYRRQYTAVGTTWSAWEFIPTQTYLTTNYYTKVQGDARYILSTLGVSNTFIEFPRTRPTNELLKAYGIEAAGNSDWYVRADRVNSRFFVLVDRDQDGTHEAPHPIDLNGIANTLHVFGSQAIVESDVAEAPTQSKIVRRTSGGTVQALRFEDNSPIASGLTRDGIITHGAGSDNLYYINTFASVASLLKSSLDAYYPPLARVLTAGAGLTGGGDLTANRTFDIVGGTGITVNANSIEVSGDVWRDGNTDTVWRDANTPSANQLAAAIDLFGTTIRGGTTIEAEYPNAGLLRFYNTSSAPAIAMRTSGVSTKVDAIRFFGANSISTPRGAISVDNDGTNYGSSSDTRLKSNQMPLTGFRERFAKLKPTQYDIIGGTKGTRGLIAHEVKEAGYPRAVVGEKGAVDSENNPIYQQLDYSSSELIADMIAMIQDLQHQLHALKQA